MVAWSQVLISKMGTTQAGFCDLFYLLHSESLGKVYFKKENKFSACLESHSLPL